MRPWGGLEEGCGCGREHRDGGHLCECCSAPQSGNTPLHMAANNDHAAVVEKLLASGADKEAKNVVREQSGVVDRERNGSRFTTHRFVS